MTIPEQIRAACHRLGLSWADFGRRLDYTKAPHQLGWKVAHGKGWSFDRVDNLGRIANALGCELHLGPETGHDFRATIGPLEEK